MEMSEMINNLKYNDWTYRMRMFNYKTHQYIKYFEKKIYFDAYINMTTDVNIILNELEVHIRKCNENILKTIEGYDLFSFDNWHNITTMNAREHGTKLIKVCFIYELAISEAD